MGFFEEYQDLKIQIWNENVNLILAEIQSGKISKETMLKINNRAHEAGISSDHIISCINNNCKVAGRLVAIDPTKQNISERLQKAYIEKHSGINNAVSILPKSGPNAINIYTEHSTTKSVDAIVLGKWITTMKIISSSGGGQDNAHQEIQNFITAASWWYQETQPNNIAGILAIVDSQHPTDIIYEEFADRHTPIIVGNSDKIAKWVKRKGIE